MTATAPGASSELVPAGEPLFTADERAALARRLPPVNPGT
jgi:hypothetical protein